MIKFSNYPVALKTATYQSHKHSLNSPVLWTLTLSPCTGDAPEPRVMSLYFRPESNGRKYEELIEAK
jgi:hypothetical protein